MNKPYNEHDRVAIISLKNRILCDSDCRAANHCYGHATCFHCGYVVCGCELNEDNLCSTCEELKRTCVNCEESFFESDYDEGVEDDDGNWFCCAECAEEYAHENHQTLWCNVCGDEFPEDQVIDGCCKKCLAIM